MCMKYFIIYSIVLACILIFIRIIYLISTKRDKPGRRSRPAKTMIILGSGGHTAEMLRIIRHLDVKNYSPRVYICAQTDKLSTEKVKDLEGGNKDYKVINIYRSREVQQSYFTSIWSTILATLNSFPILWKENPELILCNGPGTCVPLCVIAFLFKKMAHNTSMVTVPWDLLVKELKNIPVEIRLYIASIVDVLRTSGKQSTSKNWVSTSITRVEACLDRTWEALNSGYWKDVPIKYRYCYSLCIVIKAVLLEFQYEFNARNFTEKEKKVALRNIINQIDKGILLGAPLSSIPNLLTAIAAKLNSYCFDEYDGANFQKEISVDSDKINDLMILSGFSEVTYYEEPSMESFYRKIFMPKYPAVLTGCMRHWKALTLWKNPKYLHKIAGSRTVPIEIGSRYTEEDWTQHLVSFSEFLEKHVITSDSQIGYLAQHQLFEQIPELKKDFIVPEYCNFSDDMDNNEMESPDINVWFGPCGTVSPLHFDPKNNLLSQVFGYKRIILYHPDETNNLYPYTTKLLSNTAQVDPINPDYNKWPNFCKAKGVMCYLKPGEILYIPPKWWHHVTALSPSFSISFWWN